jgi:1-phosphofructokinase
MEADLEALGVRARFIRVPGETRTNLKVIESSGRLTEINGSGPQVSPDLVEDLETELLAVVGEVDAAAVVFAGSLPLGVDPAVYARWTTLLADLDPSVRVLVDASDQALELAVAAGPFLVKPNRDEAEALTDRAIDGTADAVAAARDIAARGPESVLLSLGAEGAVAVWRDDATAETIAGQPQDVPAGRLQSTVGAGDAMVARVAAELARNDGGSVGPREFFAMCRLAVQEAESQIATSTPAHDEAAAAIAAGEISPQPASLS